MADFAPSNIVRSLPNQFFIQQANRIASYRSKGADIIDLASGNPDQPTPPHLIEALKKGADQSANHGYPPFHGKQELREAVATYYRREYGVEINPETEVAIFNGAAIGISALPQALLNKNDLAVVPDPYYPLYSSSMALAGANLYYIDTQEENGYLPNYNDVPEQVWKEAKILLLNYPNNPTGAVADEDFFKKTVALAEKYNICIFNDFAYGAFGFFKEKPRSLLQTPHAKDCGIEVYTLSKTYNMAGWRVGFAVGNASVIHSINRLLEHAHSSIFGDVQDAAAAALTGTQVSVESMRQLYEHRCQVLIESFNNIGWKIKKPGGSFFVWAKIPDGYTSESFTEALLSKAHVAVSPGNGFGKKGEGFVRISLLADESKIKEAAYRISHSKLLRNTVTMPR
jgi:aminotransferase